MESNVTEKKLFHLIEEGNGPHVSLFMPTHQPSTEIRQDITRFKNCLHQAEDQLISRGLRSTKARSILEKAALLLEDGTFWHHLNRGLVLFISENTFEIMRLPLDFQEIVMTGRRFYIKPILRLFNAIERFYLLALSANSCRFFLGTRDALTKISVKGMPDRLDDELLLEDTEKNLQFHTGTASASVDRPALYHGQGGGKDGIRERTHLYVKQIDYALHGLFDGSTSPLLFAGVNSLFILFREISDYSPFIDQFLAGNPDLLQPHELHRKAWPFIEKYTERNMNAVLRRYQENADTDIASLDLRVVLQQAFQGRVETLLMKAHEYVWGKYNPHYDRVILHTKRREGDEDLIDIAAVYTLLKGGSIYVFEELCQIGGPVAALFRY